MNDMVIGFGAVVAADKAIEKKYNELLFDNFLQQAPTKKILKLKLNTNNEQNNNVDNVYLTLYDYLIETKIIKKELKKESLIKWWYIYTIDKDKIDEKTLSTLLDVKNENYPPDLKNYTVNYKNLHDFLKKYEYKLTDEYDVIEKVMKKKGGKRNKRFSKKVKPNKKKSLSKTRNKRR